LSCLPGTAGWHDTGGGAGGGVAVRQGSEEALMQVEVRVKLKQQVLDPQGEAIRRVLTGLGYAEVEQVRVGKLMLLEVAGKEEAVRARVEEACREVLSNPIIEEFEVRMP
jgi:phosphoribosylformylglycinamidine synthase PurS subunit